MGQVNLLPPDILQGQRYRRLTLTVLAAGALILALIVIFFLVQVGRLGSVNGDIEAKKQSNAALQSQIDSLQKYDDLQTQAQQAQTQLDAAYAGEVSFSGMLMDLSRVIPSDAYLDTFTATITGPPAATTGGTTSITTTPLIGTMSTGGQAIGFDSLSIWLTRLELVRGWVNPWMPTITANATVPDAFTFTTSVDLTQDVETPRGRGEVTAGG
jgi:Tfp pilus assembly protein PilN